VSEDEHMQRLLGLLGDMAAAGARHAPGAWMLRLTNLAALCKMLELKMRNEGVSFDEVLALLRIPLRGDTFAVDVDTRKTRRPL
jgi:hypothetical protein